DTALDLHRRRELAGVDAERPLEDRELLDLLDAREGLVRLVDRALDLRADRRRRVEVAGRLDLARRRLVERDERGQVLAPIADHDRFTDERRRLDHRLDVLRRDVLAARGDDDFLLAAGDRQKAVGIERAEIAGAQPAILQRFGGGRGLL